MKELKSTTYAEVEERLKNVPLEQMTKQQVIDRYVAYGTNEELNTPEIQRLLIKHNLTEYLINSVDIITDKQVIKDLLSSELLEDEDITIIESKIINIEVKKISNENNIYYSTITIEDPHTLQQYEMKGQILFDIKAIEEYKKILEPYYDNIITIVSHKDNELYVRCYLKKYEDIEYNTKELTI